jgi:hypothetical protein
VPRIAHSVVNHPTKPRPRSDDIGAGSNVFGNNFFSTSFSASGGTPPYKWSGQDLEFAILPEMKRVADPYRDLDVIDSRAPRFNQATIGLLSALAVATGWWWLLGLLALQLVIGLTLGRRFCLPCLAYFELVQPRFGEGPLEDARPPRFANLVGATFLTAATAAYGGGFETLGVSLGGLVAGLALLAAATGFCTGCEMYKLGSYLLGRPFVACPLPPRPD